MTITKAKLPYLRWLFKTTGRNTLRAFFTHVDTIIDRVNVATITERVWKATSTFVVSCYRQPETGRRFAIHSCQTGDVLGYCTVTTVHSHETLEDSVSYVEGLPTLSERAGQLRDSSATQFSHLVATPPVTPEQCAIEKERADEARDGLLERTEPSPTGCGITCGCSQCAAHHRRVADEACRDEHAGCDANGICQLCGHFVGEEAHGYDVAERTRNANLAEHIIHRMAKADMLTNAVSPSYGREVIALALHDYDHSGPDTSECEHCGLEDGEHQDIQGPDMPGEPGIPAIPAAGVAGPAPTQARSP